MKLKIFSISFGILMLLAGTLILTLTIISILFNRSQTDIVINTLALSINTVLFFIESFLFFRGLTHPALILPGLCFKENSKLNKIPMLIISVAGLISLIFTILFALESASLTTLFGLSSIDNYLFLSISLTVFINSLSAVVFFPIARFEVY